MCVWGGVANRWKGGWWERVKDQGRSSLLFLLWGAVASLWCMVLAVVVVDVGVMRSR